ncbi:MAG TPA: DUF3892 domain-containing protein [Thermoleophilaceae bacterium]|jgi:hypothetical protein
MERPDTIVEVHRERAQADSAAEYSGGRYTQPYPPGDYMEKGTVTVNLTLDRVWFVLDAHGRLWQEEDAPGQAHDPARHFAIDLRLDDSKVVITDIGPVSVPPLGDRTVTIPDGQYRGGQSRTIPNNELPLYGHLTVHEQLGRRVLPSGLEQVSLNFNAEDAPRLVAGPAPDPPVSNLFAAAEEVDRRANGSTAFGGQDPRVIWDLDSAEVYWITHSNVGELLVDKERITHPTETDEQLGRRVLDSIAGRIRDAVRAELVKLGDGDGVVDLLPDPGLKVDPASTEPDVVRELDVKVQRYPVGAETHESMVIQLRTMDELPPEEALPISVLAENPSEHTALAATGYGLLLGVRDTVKRSFCLDDEDFDDSAPCLLKKPLNIEITGETRRLESFEATIVERTDSERGRLVVEGRISDSTWYYEFDAPFRVTYELDLDDVPREALVSDDPDESEIGTSTGETLAALQSGLREAADAKCRGEISADDYEAELVRVRPLVAELPRGVGVAPTLRPPKPEVTPDFSPTTLGYIVGALGLIAIVATPYALAYGIGALLTVEAIVGLLVFATIEFVVTLIAFDWIGNAMVRGGIQSALGKRPGGTVLPTIGVPIDVWLGHHLAVYYRRLPPRLGVSCVKRDTPEDVDAAIQVVGGRWPTDGKLWKISVNDGAQLLQDDEVELDLFIEAEAGGGIEQPIHVSHTEEGRAYLRADPDDAVVDNLASLPECPVTPEL